ncbi:acetyltransferase [Rhodococcus ruber Chol-4]|jgi:RimJ/RimL family protein N-acetyltransferase|uniref:Putative acetyltransferase n=1 Tax=Rhodococcus ruber TaxID=1830 RepID=A0A098BQJ5_9NOCA|nr:MULTISPECIES: GNAT family N-acetyltransferase [Rhodococcus]MDO2376930.1 GNAT family N-acetyltransferase [Rhodococcus ruber]RIK13269.1 MAG: N-acetyltransferase [Acidobacteriota bacterium]ATQ31011.1 N-acetyltransferase [Rhodococcus ruber]AUM16362.1 N-acetyltransferase [Rhodococcus ruber]AWG97953.1 N-acetyltransferase [Rhodococcus ruber]
MRPVVLTGSTVVLTVPRAGDVDAITAACRDRSIVRWTTVPDPYTRADAQRFVGDVVPAGWAAHSPVWAVRTSADGPLLGTVGLIERDASAAEIGYWIAPAARARGLATESVNLLCDYAFRSDGLKLDRIEWRALAGHRASAAVARRVGFRFEGVQRRGILQRGSRHDAWVAGLLPDDPRVPADGWPM